MNKVILSGHLTRDVEVRYSQQNKAFARCGIAVNRPFSKDAVDFFNLVALGKTAETMGKYLAKGSKIIVEGSLHTSNYEKDGAKRTSTDILVDSFEFADSKKKAAEKSDDPFAGEPVPDDDTPF